MKLNEREMGRTKSFNLSILTALFVFLFPICFSMAGSNRPLPPGDYIFNSQSGEYEPFYPDSERTVTDFVSDCDNSPGLQRNADQFRFIKTALIGEDDRCELQYGPKVDELEKSLYGVGLLMERGQGSGSREKRPRAGTAHLVGKRNILITNAHTFADAKTGIVAKESYKQFVFFIKEWIPENKRKNLKIEYEFRGYRLKNVEFGTLSPETDPQNDYAFVELEMPVSESVEGVSITKGHQVKPLPFRKISRASTVSGVYTVGFHRDKGMIAQKNCKPFGLYRVPRDHNLSRNGDEGLIIHYGDTMPGASGSSIFVIDESGKPVFTGLHIGSTSYETDGGGGSYTSDKSDFNYAIDGNYIFEKFQSFVKKSNIQGRN